MDPEEHKELRRVWIRKSLVHQGKQFQVGGQP
ncbi:rCG31541, partial [Rattus norvegicus]